VGANPSSLHGFLVVDKPAGLTSHDVVDRARHWFPRGTRIGHTGTLDPLATGVLVLCVGVATRLAEYVQGMRKTYRTTIFLGARSDTDDAEGTITPVAAARVPDLPAVEQVLAEFVGWVDQVPPAYSAIKVSGRRAYELARKGEELALHPRRVQIDRIDLLAFDYPRLELEVRCGEGTYIRSLARDIGERLGCGGYVQLLRRTRLGGFEVADALPLDADPKTARAKLLPVEAAVQDMPLVTLAADQVARLRRGQQLVLASREAAAADAADVVAVDASRRLVAVCKVQNGRLQPKKVLPLL
jgi:tRNA pseudouridine55 synthase